MSNENSDFPGLKWTYLPRVLPVEKILGISWSIPAWLPSAVHEGDVINHTGEVFNGWPIHACKHRNIRDEEKLCDCSKLEDLGTCWDMLDTCNASWLLLGLGMTAERKLDSHPILTASEQWNLGVSRTFTQVKEGTLPYNTILGATERRICPFAINAQESTPEVLTHSNLKAETFKSKVGLFSALQPNRLLARSFHPDGGKSDLISSFSGAHWSGNLVSLEAPSGLGCAGMLSLLLSSPSAKFQCPNFGERMKASSAIASSPLQHPVLRAHQDQIRRLLPSVCPWLLSIGIFFPLLLPFYGFHWSPDCAFS